MNINNAWYFIYNGSKVLSNDNDNIWQPLAQHEWLALSLTALNKVYIGMLYDAPCYGIELKRDTAPPVNYCWTSLRKLLFKFGEPIFAIAGRGLQLLEWLRTHKFCGQCAQPMQDKNNEQVRYCANCDKLYYPRLSPCIIVLVTNGPKLLLANGVGHPETLYSTLAGFIEVGETAEQAVHREVKEEVDIDIKTPIYQGSQSWPFPHQLMLGFEAEYHSGELCCDKQEIADARWWHYTELPEHPQSMTIAGRLINNYVQRVMAKYE